MPKQENEGTYSSSELPGSRKLAAGISLTLVANLILLSISFTVRENTLYGGELCLTKGILQTFLFVLFACCLFKRDASSLCLPATAEDRLLRFYIVVYGVSVGVMSLTAYVALTMIPVSEVIVICFTAPIFTIVFSAFILRSSLTLLKFFLCITLIAGVVLVVQPPFLFPKNDQHPHAETTANETWPGNINNITSPMVHETNGSIISNYPDHVPISTGNYFLGVAASLVCGATGSLANVCAARCQKCPNAILMVAAGLGTLLVAVLCPLIGVQNRIFTEITNLLFPDWLLIVGVSSGSILSSLILIAACKIATPTVVIMVRSSELLLAIFVEVLVFDLVPTPLAAVGSVLVLASITAMTLVDKIQEWLLKFCCSGCCGCSRCGGTKAETSEGDNAPPAATGNVLSPIGEAERSLLEDGEDRNGSA